MPAWYAGVYEPDRVAALGSLCTPYLPWSPSQAAGAGAAPRPAPPQYVRTIQHPGVAEEILGRDVEGTFRSLLRARGYTMDEFESAPSAVRDIPLGVLVGEPQLLGAPIVSEEELRFYIDVYKRSGFTGGLNWYRAHRSNVEDACDLDYRIDRPALLITAADDWFWDRGSTAGMPQLLAQLEAHIVLDAERCILCTRCVRVCAEIEGAHVWDVMGRGINSMVITDLHEDWGKSGCTRCGKCVQVCPTGALFDKSKIGSDHPKYPDFLPYLNQMREAQ